MKTRAVSILIISFAAPFLATPFATAQQDPASDPIAPTPPASAAPAPPSLTAVAIDVDDAITAVTLYRGRAAVTRGAHVDLKPGLYDLRFTNLPATAQSNTLQTRIEGDAGGAVGAGAESLKVINVDFVQEAVAEPETTPQVAELDKRIRSIEQSIRAMTNQRSLIKSQQDFLDALTIRTTADASAAAGTSTLDLDEIKNQMQFITAERKRLHTETSALDIEQPKLMADLEAALANRKAAAGAASVTRTAIVTVVASAPFQGSISLTYLVSNATWQPAYNVRAASDLSKVAIEYDAILTQRTGEDWSNISLTLSTAQPTVAANPPSITPWYVDIAQPETARRSGFVNAPAEAMDLSASMRDRGVDGARELEDKAVLAEKLKQLSADADIAGDGGPAVTFQLPRTIAIETNSERQQRTRIASFDASARFVHVATPLLTEAVYLRGDLTNSSAFQLLPGPASIFVGQDYIGPTAIGEGAASIAPGSELKMHFGIDQTVTARKQLLSKSTENTGLLSGGRRTVYSYRISIDNGSGRDLTLELWDRIPVSRNEEIQIDMLDLNTPLATDAFYTAEERPLGLLKWWITIPASARGTNASLIAYTLRVDRGKNITMTPLPD